MKSKKIVGALLAAVVILAGAGIVYLTVYYGHNSQKGDLNIAVASVGSSPVGKNISSIYVTFDKISIRNSSSTWNSHSLGNQSVNIMTNATKNNDLASFAIDAESYSAVKVYITSVKATVNGTTETFSPPSSPFEISSFQNQSFNQNPYFMVHPHVTTILLLEFHTNSDLNFSSGNFNPSPKVLTTF